MGGDEDEEMKDDIWTSWFELHISLSRNGQVISKETLTLLRISMFMELKQNSGLAEAENTKLLINLSFQM